MVPLSDPKMSIFLALFCQVSKKFFLASRIFFGYSVIHCQFPMKIIGFVYRKRGYDVNCWYGINLYIVIRVIQIILYTSYL